MKKLFSVCSLLVAALLSVVHLPASASDAIVHKVAIHVDDNDPKRMNLALNNVVNVQRYYDEIGEEVVIEVVAYGPGLHMLIADSSPVKDRIVTLALASDNLTFSACGNTHRNMVKKAGKDIELMEETVMVPSGVIQLITLQEQGYSYLKP